MWILPLKKTTLQRIRLDVHTSNIPLIWCDWIYFFALRVWWVWPILNRPPIQNVELWDIMYFPVTINPQTDYFYFRKYAFKIVHRFVYVLNLCFFVTGISCTIVMSGNSDQCWFMFIQWYVSSFNYWMYDCGIFIFSKYFTWPWFSYYVNIVCVVVCLQIVYDGLLYPAIHAVNWCAKNHVQSPFDLNWAILM